MTAATLYQFERTTELALAAQLTAAGAGEAVYPRHALTAELPPAYLAIESGLYSRASPQIAFSASGQPFYNHYSGQLTVIVQTPRDEAGVAQHAAWLGLVRSVLATLTLPPYEVLEVEETGGGVTYIREGESDRSELAVTVQLAIPGPVMD